MVKENVVEDSENVFANGPDEYSGFEMVVANSDRQELLTLSKLPFTTFRETN
jgi:hypothetical protein